MPTVFIAILSLRNRALHSPGRLRGSPLGHDGDAGRTCRWRGAGRGKPKHAALLKGATTAIMKA